MSRAGKGHESSCSEFQVSVVPSPTPSLRWGGGKESGRELERSSKRCYVQSGGVKGNR